MTLFQYLIWYLVSIFEKTGTPPPPPKNTSNSNQKINRNISRRISLWIMGHQSTLGEHDPHDWLCFSSNLRKSFKQNMKKRGKKRSKKHIFLINSRMEDRVSGLNDMAYSYLRYTIAKHLNSDIWNIERELWRLQNFWVPLMCLRDFFFLKKYWPHAGTISILL